jgi:hypothetical protein
LETARGTVTLLNEVLDGAEKEGNYAAVKEEYCLEVAGACDAIKERVAALLDSAISDEGVVSAAIEVNDDAQRALDRRMVLMEIADGRRAAPVGVATATTPTAAAAAAAPAAETTTTAATTAPAPANLMDLLDLDWTPTPEPGTSVADPFLPPPPMIPPPMNNPFAAAGGAAAGVVGAVGALAAAGATSGKQYSPKGGSTSQVSSPVAAAATGVASPSAASADGEKSKSNPFLNDDAFSQLSLSRETSGVSAPPPATVVPITVPTPASPGAAAAGQPLSSRPSGNPFASASAESGGAAFNRPPSLVIPGHDPIAAGFTPGPYTAPAGGAGGAAFFGSGAPPAAGNGSAAMTTSGMMAPSPAYQAFHAPLPTAGAVPYHHQQQQHYSAQQFSATGAGANAFGAPSPYVPTPNQQHQSFGGAAAPTPGMYGTNQMPGQPPVSDSFKDLVVLKPKKEEAPPPPKGSPMRRGGGSTPKIGGGSVDGNGNGTGGSSSPRPEVTAAPVATTEPAAAAAPAPVAASASAVSAFDAFDALASGR